MRWLALFVVGACSFTPGTQATSGDARIGAGDAPADMASIELDAAPDVAVAPAELVRTIDVVDALVTGGPHADFPLLVSLTATWLRDGTNGGDVARADGFDVYFSADAAGSTRLAHEVELYDPAAGALIAWVKIPSLTASSVIYVHYGDDAITTSQQDVPGVWSSGFELVLHLDAISDATGKTTSSSATTQGGTAGKIDRGVGFDGIDNRIDLGSATAVDDIFTGGGTAEAWLFADTFGEASFGRMFDKGQEGGWGMYVSNGGSGGNQTLALRHGGASGSIGSWFSPDGSLTTGAWHHAVVVYDQSSSANDPLLYVDGVSMTVTEVDVPTGPMDSDAAAPLWIGNRSSLDRAFDGVLDEMRLSSVSRSAGWIATEYRNQADPATFYTVSAPL